MAGKRKTVLLIDDSLDFRVLTRRILEGAGFTVIEAESVAQGLREGAQAAPHLVITDLMMKGENGFSFLEKRRQIRELERVPTIVLSAVDHQAHVLRAIALGAYDYVIKPIEPQALLRRVRKALDDERFLRFTFPPGAASTARARVAGRIVRAGECGFEIEVPVRVGVDMKVEVESPLFERLNYALCILKSAARSGRLVDAGYFQNFIRPIGLPEEIARAIRKAVRAWK